MMNGGAFFPMSKGILCVQGQGQALHDLVRDQRLLAASSEAHYPVSGQTGGSHQSEVGAERESLRRPHGGIVRAKIHESQAN